MALTDPRMAIDPASPLTTAVVEMPDPDPIHTDRPVEIMHRPIVIILGRERIACRENMAGIDANPKALRGFDLREDRAEVLEPVPETSPLPRRRFQGNPGGQAFGPVMDLIDARRDPLQAFLFTGTDVRPEWPPGR